MRFLLPLSLLVTLLFTACGSDTVSESATVEGRWELARALRNNMETKMLDGLYFEFAPDGTLGTNLMGNEAPGAFVWEETSIATTGVIPELTYEITELTDSTLHLRTELQDYRFDFEMVR